MAHWHKHWLEVAIWLGCAFLLGGLYNGAYWWLSLIIWLVVGVGIVFIRRFGWPAEGLLYVGFLFSVGWLFLYRLSPQWAFDQLRGFGLGVVAFLVGLLGMTRVKLKYTYGLGALVLLLITLIWGVQIGGARAWLSLGVFRFQPVEFARVLLVLFMVNYLFDNQDILRLRENPASIRHWSPLVVLLSGVFLLLAVQRDLGPALLVFLVYLALSLSLVFSWRLLFVNSALAISGFFMAYFLFPHFRNRIIAWLNPNLYPDSIGYQTMQGLFAYDAGNFFGKGIGAGMGEVIPEVHTDYMIGLIGEELGLVGTTAILLVYLCLAFWGLKIAMDANSPHAQFTALALTLLWNFQLFMVIGGSLRLVPLTGMTLPFMSYGSSSLVAHFWVLGMITSLGRMST